MELNLLVFWATEETLEKDEQGIDYDVTENDVLQHTFYEISHIAPYDDKYCRVVSGGQTYIVTEPYEIVKDKIKKQKVMNLN